MEALIASLVVLVVLSALALAARFFFVQSRRVEERRSALIVAGAVMDDALDTPGLPEAGDSSWVQTAAGEEYSVSRRVAPETEDSRLVTVTVSCGSGGSVDLTGKAFAR